MEPNRHAIVFEATNGYSGQRYRSRLVPFMRGDLAEAETELEVTRARFAAPLAAGMFRDPAMSDLVLIGLASWHEDENPTFGPAPLSGPEWDRAWDAGPGAKAED